MEKSASRSKFQIAVKDLEVYRSALLKAPDCYPRKEVISATHEEVIGEQNAKEVLEGGSFWSTSGQTHEPLCMLHRNRREGQSDRKGSTSGLKELEAGIFECDNEQQQVEEELESGQVGTEREQQQAWERSLEDGLVGKLVSQFCLFPVSSKACPQELEREIKELSLQDTELHASVSRLKGDISEHGFSPASLERPSTYVGKSEGLFLSQSLGEVAALSIKNNVGPTKLKSALRGGYEKAGLGPRSKVHVTWAPDVYDPPCTSTSHTSSLYHRRHHHPRSEHKNRHKGKGSSHSDTRKKSQKKMSRRLKHAGGETFLSGPTVVSQRGILNNPLMLKEYIAPSLDDLTSKNAKVSPFILPQKGCFLNPVLSFDERDLVTLEKIQGCRLQHVQTHKLCL